MNIEWVKAPDEDRYIYSKGTCLSELGWIQEFIEEIRDFPDDRKDTELFYKYAESIDRIIEYIEKTGKKSEFGVAVEDFFRKGREDVKKHMDNKKKLSEVVKK